MRLTTAICILGVFISLPACSQSVGNAKRPPEALVSNPNYDKPVGLAIHGFNYTDRVIELFSINNRGGGNIAVSSPTSGGGKTTCCLRWYPGSQLSRPVKIEWMRYRDDKERWCEKTVMLKATFPENPTNVAVHFMPDGDIQVELTDSYPDPKLRLQNYDDGHRKKDGNVIHNEQTAKCQSTLE